MDIPRIFAEVEIIYCKSYKAALDLGRCRNKSITRAAVINQNVCGGGGGGAQLHRITPTKKGESRVCCRT